MPSNKILFILILCIGVVTSVYLVTKNSGKISSPTPDSGIVDVNPYVNLDQNSNNDWKKILLNIDLNESTTTILTNVDPEMFDETTLTAQMSRDFLSQYLWSVKGGAVTPEESAKIAQNILSVPGYTSTSGAKYIS